MMHAIWEHRTFIAGLVRRDFQVRSVRAVWGNIWLVLEPAAQVLIYTLVFGRVLGARLGEDSDEMAYGIYICAGIITWNFFYEVVSRSQTLFLEHAPLLKTMPIPRSSLPLALLITAGINFGIIASIFLGVLALTGHWPGLVVLAALPLLLVQIAIAVGIGLVTGTINVFFRDTTRIVGILIQFWFWLTPIVYPISIIPEAIEPIFVWNPMVPIVEGYHSIVLKHEMPHWESMIGPLFVASTCLFLGWFVFRKLSHDLVDEL